MLVLWVPGCGESHKGHWPASAGRWGGLEVAQQGPCMRGQHCELVSRALEKPLNPRSCLSACRRTD